MSGENNNEDPSRKGADSRSSWQTTFDRLRGSPFAQRATEFAKGEVDRLLGYQQTGRMDASRAQQLSNNLHQMMANLIVGCKEEQRKLRTGGVLGIGARELSAQDIDTSVAGLTAITFHLLNEMMEHIRRARKVGSFVAMRFMPITTDDSGQVPAVQSMASAGLGGTGVVGAFALPPDRLRLIGDQLRGLHEYAIKFATDIEEDIAGPHAASPSNHEKALSKAIMLTQRLDAGCQRVLQLMDPTIDAKLVLSGNTGQLPALPSKGERENR